MDSGRIVISATNQGPLVNVLAWVFMVVMLITTMTKIGSKMRRMRKLQADDFLLAAAAVVAVAQTIATSEQVTAGLGSPWATLSADDVAKFYLTGYAAQLLFVVANALTKIATASFVVFLTPFQWVSAQMRRYIVFVAGWALIAFLVIAFQCHVPRTWIIAPGRCMDRTAFWIAFAVIDAITDLGITIMPAIVVGALEISRVRKFGIFVPFVARILTLPMIIVRIVYLTASYRSKDPSLSAAAAAIATETQMHLSITLACLPFVKTVIDSMQHGFITGDFAYSSGGGQGVNLVPLTIGKLGRPLSRAFRRRSKTSPRGSDAGLTPVQLSGIEYGRHELQAVASIEAPSPDLPPDHIDEIAIRTTVTVELEGVND